MGLPDMDLYTADDNLRSVNHVAQAGDLAIMADLDNGYGGPLTVARVAERFEAAGASASCWRIKPARNAARSIPANPRTSHPWRAPRRTLLLLSRDVAKNERWS